MERYAGGEEDAFEAVYDAVEPRIHQYLRRQTGDAAWAEDLVQLTMLQIHRARGSFLPGAEVMPWAFAIARRLLIDDIRRQRRSPRVASAPSLEQTHACPGPLPDEELHARELSDRLRAELDRLPPSQLEAFALVRQEGLTLAEAAGVLGITITAVKLRAHRALQRLRGLVPPAPGDAE